MRLKEIIFLVNSKNYELGDLDIDYTLLNKMCREAQHNCVLFEHDDNEGTIDFYKLENICPNFYITSYYFKAITSFDFYLFNGSKFAHNPFALT